MDAFTSIRVVQNCSDRNLQDDITSFLSRSVRAFAVPPAFSFVFRIEAKMHERVVTLAGFHDDVAAPSAVAARRSPARDKLLPPKGHAAITAVSGFYANFGFIDEHQLLSC